jgi:hypothetical protein
MKEKNITREKSRVRALVLDERTIVIFCRTPPSSLFFFFPERARVVLEHYQLFHVIELTFYCMHTYTQLRANL